MWKNSLKAVSLLCLALTVTACGEGFIVVMGVGAIGVMIVSIFVIIGQNEDKREKEKRRQEWRAKMEAEREARINAYDSGLTALRSEFGEADKTIAIAEYDLDREIRVYSGRNAVTILGKTYDFKAILSCSCTDDYAVSRGDAAIKADGHSATDTGNLIGRSVVGGLIGGEAGALIGGATASTSTSMTGTIKYGDDRLKHNYTVWVTVRDIALPIIEIHTGADARLTNEVVALLNVIIEGNKA